MVIAERAYPVVTAKLKADKAASGAKKKRHAAAERRRISKMIPEQQDELRRKKRDAARKRRAEMSDEQRGAAREREKMRKRVERASKARAQGKKVYAKGSHPVKELDFTGFIKTPRYQQHQAQIYKCERCSGPFWNKDEARRHEIECKKLNPLHTL